MLSNAKHMQDKYTKHSTHILCSYLQYADYGQCICRATLPIKVKDVGKEKRRKEKAVPRAAAA